MVERNTDFGTVPIDTTPIPVGGLKENGFEQFGKNVEEFLEARQMEEIRKQREAQKSYLSALNLEVLQNAQEIGEASVNNPAKIKREGEVFINGFLDQVPKPLRREYRARFNKDLSVHITAANKNASTAIEANARANREQEAAFIEDETARAARGLLSDDPNQVIASQEFIEQAQLDLDRVITEHTLDVNGNPVPIFTPEQARTRRNEFVNDVAQNALLQGFIDSPDQANYLLDIKEGKGPTYSIRMGLSADGKRIKGQTDFQEVTWVSRLNDKGRKELESKMENILKFKNDQTAADEKRADEVREQNQNVNIAKKWDAFNNNRTSVTAQEVIDGIESQELPPTQGLVLLKAISRPNVTTDDTNVFNTIAGMIESDIDASNAITRARAEGTLTGASAHNLAKENEGKQDALLGIAAGPRKTLVDQQRTLLRQSLQAESTAISRIFQAVLGGDLESADPTENIRIGNIMTIYNERALDPSEDPALLRQQLIQRGRVDDVTLQKRLGEKILPFAIRDMAGPSFSRSGFIEQAQEQDLLTEAAKKLFEAKKRGDMSREEFDFELKNIEEWQVIVIEMEKLARVAEARKNLAEFNAQRNR